MSFLPWSPVPWARFGALSRTAGVLLPLRKPPVLVVSLPRSGSSWVGKVLGQADNAVYLREPFTQSHLPTVPETGAVFPVDPFRPPGTYRRAAAAATRGVPAFRGGIVQTSPAWKLHRRPLKRLVVKEVNPLALPWLLERLQPRVLYLVRHPAAVALSFYRRGWTGPDFRAANPDGSRASTGEQDRFWIDHGAFQAKVAEFALTALARHSGVRVVTYESLCRDPGPAFRDLFRFAGLRWGPAAEAVLARTTAAEDEEADPYGVSRDSGAMAEAWRDGIPQQGLHQLKAAYLAADTALYPADAW